MYPRSRSSRLAFVSTCRLFWSIFYERRVLVRTWSQRFSCLNRIRNFPDWIMFGWIKFPSVDLTIQIQESKDLTWSEPDGTKRFVINLFMYVKHQTSFERFIVIGYSFADVVYKDYPKWCLTTSPFPPAVDFKANSFALKAHLQNKSLISLSGWLV